MESDSKIEKLVNYIMKQGKKNIARKILEGTLKVIKENGHTNPRVVIDTALENAAPQIMVKSRRV
jgi:small subunit ribosomal protein S7